MNLLQGAEENNKGNKFQHVTLSPLLKKKKVVLMVCVLKLFHELLCVIQLLQW